MDEQTPAVEAAKTEAARQVIILAFAIVGTGIMIWAQRHASDPDFARSHRMRAAKQAERRFARLAAWAWQRAEQARLWYEQERA